METKKNLRREKGKKKRKERGGREDRKKMEGKKGGCGKKDVKVGSYQFR